MKWYRVISTVLKQEPEVWLAYLYGQQLENMPHLMRRKPRRSGFSWRLLVYGAFVLRRFALVQSSAVKSEAEILIFAATRNQMSVVEGVFSSLEEKGQKVIGVANMHLLNTPAQKKKYIPLKFSILDVIGSLVLMVARGPMLYKDLGKKNPIAVKSYLDKFCSVYIYMVYFYRVLNRVKPKFVIVSNDHSPANRSLLAIAHYMGVKTVYVQHASVSNLFPALRMDYAFLDGVFALDVYRECESNQPVSARSVPMPKVVLSGQKKKLKTCSSSGLGRVGIALNALDNVGSVIKFIAELGEAGVDMTVRWHPRQPPEDVDQYVSMFKEAPNVKFSDPALEPISEFMSNLRWLVAGNSSIHLEAALSSVAPIYYEFNMQANPDYYGYVKHGLAKPAGSAEDVIKRIESGHAGEILDVEAIRYYSATYRSLWDGREGELVAECMVALLHGRSLPVEIHQLESDSA